MKNLHGRDSRLYQVESLCRLFGVTKQAYYKHDENRILQRVAQESFAVSYINEIREKDPGIGGLKLWHMYRREFTGNNPLGRDRFEDIVDRYGLKVRKRVRKPRTTDSTHGLPVFPNLVRGYIPLAPNRLWVSDITYITTWVDNTHYVFCYLSLILDAYTKEIVGWCVGPTLDTEYSLRALDMALERIKNIPIEDVNLTHHSDRGCQYASSKYINKLQGFGVKISMTECGDPKDNEQAERINNTMKNELLKGMRFHSLKDVEDAVDRAVKFYNEERPHMSIDMMTPHEAALHVGELTKRWTSLREKHIKEQQSTCTIAEECLPLQSCVWSPSGLCPSSQPHTGIRMTPSTNSSDNENKSTIISINV